VTAPREVTAADLTDEMIGSFWDHSKCGDPKAGCPGSDPNGWDSDKGWSVITPEDARLAMSSVPIFGVGDLQGYWRSRDAARARIAAAINARSKGG
jgi:hypothetical protein